MAPGFILSRFRLGIITQWAIFAVPLLLLIAPALYYSLDAPLGLLEGPSVGTVQAGIPSMMEFIAAQAQENAPTVDAVAEGDRNDGQPIARPPAA